MSRTDERRLLDNEYPGRTIVLGVTPDGKRAVQVYITMGRSEGSRMRILAQEGGVVKTLPVGEVAREKPELYIYTAAVDVGDAHVVTNGRQTDSVAEGLKAGKTMEQSLEGWQYEDDPPILTPRISGITRVAGGKARYQLSILKAAGNDPNRLERHFFRYDDAVAGLGHCIHTYAANENPCPPFSGEPFPLGLMDDMQETMDHFWGLLKGEFRVSMMVKFIDLESGKTELLLRNAQEA